MLTPSPVSSPIATPAELLAQPFSTTLLDSFLRAATEVSRIAIGNPNAVSATVKHVSDPRVTQHPWDRLEGALQGRSRILCHRSGGMT